VRVLYIDIDTLRPDHLGCYGYHRDTSPCIDRVAARGVRFEHVYASDTPCLPSRTALFSGRFGIHTGVIGHGGTAADLFVDGPSRGFNSLIGRTGWMRCIRDAGLRTVTISPFAERHGAMHFYANFNEVHNTGRRGLETADTIAGAAIDWIDRNASGDHWFLHVNLWDPHTPYRTPAAYGEPFAGEPLPAWYSDDVRRAHWQGAGPHSAREVNGWDDQPGVYRPTYPRHPLAMDSMDAARQLFDGYDTGVRYADDWVGRILDALEQRGVGDECAILISADHGENLGELNIYGDHHTADQHTARVPWILCWPGVTDRQAGRVDTALHYQFDLAATVVALLGGQVSDVWDGRGFAQALRQGQQHGRDALILSQGAWTCQRAVRWQQDGGEYLCIRSDHDGYHGFADHMLFDVAADPHEQVDLAGSRPELVDRAMAVLASWHGDMMRTSRHAIDPMWTVLREGGPVHVRGKLPGYVERLRATGRGDHADALLARHGSA
jgi:arylsulfatase A-like enzyme